MKWLEDRLAALDYKGEHVGGQSAACPRCVADRERWLLERLAQAHRGPPP